MRIFLPAALTVAVLGRVFASDEACSDLTESSSPFYQDLSTLAQVPLGVLPIEQVMGPLDKAFPRLSKCVGSLKVGDVVGIVNGAADQLSQCANGISMWESQGSGSGLSASDNDYFKSYMCPSFREQLIPCVNGVMNSIVQKILDSSPCCDDMQDQFVDSFGYVIPDMVNALLSLAGNALCSSHSYTQQNGTKLEEVCGWTMVNGFMGQDFPDSLLNALQIPSEGGCNAMTGNKFKTTMGDEASFFQHGQTPVDVCFKPLDDLLSHISKYPIMKSLSVTDGDQTIMIANLFSPGACVNGGSFLEWLVADDSVFIKLLSMYDDTMAVIASLGGSSGSQSNFGRSGSGSGSKYHQGGANTGSSSGHGSKHRPSQPSRDGSHDNNNGNGDHGHGQGHGSDNWGSASNWGSDAGEIDTSHGRRLTAMNSDDGSGFGGSPHEHNNGDHNGGGSDWGSNNGHDGENNGGENNGGSNNGGDNNGGSGLDNHDHGSESRNHGSRGGGHSWGSGSWGGGDMLSGNITDIIRGGIRMIKPYASQFCFHLPNSVAATCSYNCDTISAAYDTTSVLVPPAPTPRPSPTLKTTPKPKATKPAGGSTTGTPSKAGSSGGNTPAPTPATATTQAKSSAASNVSVMMTLMLGVLAVATTMNALA